MIISEAVRLAKAYSTGHGLIAADGMLSIELPDQEAEVSPLDET